MERTDCEIVCDGFHEGRYHCYAGTTEWVPSLPHCVRAVHECVNPGPPSNGRFLMIPPPTLGRHRPLHEDDPQYPEDTSLEYSCKPPYVLRGILTITCGSTGRWSSDPPICVQEVHECKNPGPPSNGRFLLLLPPTAPRRLRPPHEEEHYYPEGTRLQYSCEPSYVLRGIQTIACRSTERWSSDPPTCVQEVRECVNPGPLSNGRFLLIPPPSTTGRPPHEDDLHYPENTTLVYSCEPPYVLWGNHNLTCESKERWSSDPPTCVQDCGRSALTRRRIYHGTVTQPGEWPWVVAISPEGGPLKCGGVLVNRRTVLTAAHCVNTNSRYVLHFGKYNLTQDDDQVVDSRSTRLIVHENYNDATFANDIALVKFFPSVLYTDRIRPICLPTRFSQLKHGNYGYMAGWGQIENGLKSEELLMAHLPVQSHEKCVGLFPQGFIIKDEKFCAGMDHTLENGGATSPCLGDSGSGLVFEQHGRFTVEGIVSSSFLSWCGVPGKYTVFTNVSQYMPWIRSKLK